jgi:hypothetical protein
MMDWVVQLARIGKMTNEYKVRSEHLKGIYHLKYLVADAIIRKDRKETECKDTCCTHVVQDWIQWRDFLNTVMHLEVS